MDYALVVLIEVLNAVAVLVLVSAGLAVIFGMMKVINIAQGEFLMLGAYAAIIAVHAGLNIWLAMFVAAPLAVGLFGLVVEACLIRFLYGRMLDSLLATWGLSLFMIGGVTLVFGNTMEGLATPLGGFEIGAYHSSWYTLVMIAVAVVLLAAVVGVLRYTRFGLIARGTMQNPAMAAGLGISPPKVYLATFGIGSALAGLAGALLAPMTGVVPSMGAAFIAKAFITVIGGGASIVTGMGMAAGFFGAIGQLGTFAMTPVWGDAAMLFAALLMLRVLPRGITGRFLRGAI